MAWWEALTALERFFVLLAMPATLLLLLQTALLLIGMGGQGASEADSDVDADVDLDLEADVDADAALDFDTDGDGADLADESESPVHSHGPDCPRGHGVVEGHDHSLRLFSLRTLVAFFAVFGWTGVVLLKAGMPEWTAVLLALPAGGLSMLLLAWLFKLALDLQSDGNLNPRSTVGLTGEVYLTIPANRAGAGKITLLTQGRYAEFDAVTDSPVPIVTGTRVTVRAASEDFTLTVASTEQEIEMGGTSNV